ncbi:MAG: hypothetical protein K6T51_02450 [Rubrobacteraceae bacterium]|nr:hypothetical protein [Rubrobacteraceae bacterium]MCL6437444.1 hypothetical protein [Rubrobacteraceae bacterium]
MFLEKNYARDIATFRRALSEARTWGELRSMVSAERYEETVDKWIESKIDNIMSENDLEDEEGIEVDPPKPDDAFDPDEISAYADSYWPEWAPDMMSDWLGHEIIERYGFLVETILDTSYPVIAHENEKQVVSLLEKQGYSCIRDDDLVWDAVW